MKNGDQSIMSSIGGTAIDTMLTRTAQGVDVNNRPFDPYSKKYEEKTGKTTPDLNQSGKMLRAIRKKADKKVVRIYVEPTAHKGIDSFNLSRVHDYGLLSGRPPHFNMTRREFFGLTADDKKYIMKELKEMLNDKIRAARR